MNCSVFYGHSIINNDANQDCVTVSATSSQGWTVLLWEDTNHNGVHETNNPNEPPLTNPVCIPGGGTYYLVVELQVPAGAVAGTVDQTVVRAVSGNSPTVWDSATDTTEVFVNAPPVIDGKYDDIYKISPDAREVCYTSGGVLFGKLATFYQASGNAVYVVLAIDKDFVDNTYGANKVNWGTKSHNFSDLVGSDHAQFWGYNASDTKVLDFDLDYLTAKSGTPSGYASLGVSGGDGGMNLGSAAHILQWGTSLAYSLNSTGYCSGGNCSGLGTNLLVDSPATDSFYTPNPTYPDWIFDVIYEVKIDVAAFGANGFGAIEVPYIHASPSKLGTNTIYAEPGVCPGEIGDFVWYDSDGDGVQDPGEAGINGVQVKLYQDNGDGVFDPGTDILKGTQTTTAGGKYLFQNLAPNDYFVDVVDATVPAGYDITTFNDPTPLISLSEGESYLQADFGYVQGGSIGDRVWYDEDNDGVQDSGEVGINGVTVKLYTGTCAQHTEPPLRVTTTSGDGDYLFSAVPAGDYCVVVDEDTLPSPGYVSTTLNNPLDVSLSIGQDYLEADFGYVVGGAIGDFVWYDADGDGIQDVGEPGIPNVRVELYKGATKVASTVTDADGGYLFTNLVPGNYTVDVADAANPNGPLDGMVHTLGAQSQPDPTNVISLGAGQVYKDADFGYRRVPGGGKAVIGDTVWYDDNGDGVQQPGEPGIPGIEVCATDAGGEVQGCATTDSNGHYLLEVPAGSYLVAPTNPPAGFTATTPVPHGPVILVAGQQYLAADFGYNDTEQNLLGQVGDLVFLDKDRDGVFAGADTALAGVSVDLIRDVDGDGVWDAGEPIIATVTTAGSLDGQGGNYLFTGVPAGRYLVHVSDTNGVLADFVKSPLGTAGMNNHNQADPYPVHLATPGAGNRTADFGYYQVERSNVGVIGNQVWVEPVDNGWFDVLEGDFGQPGVTVQLLDGQGVVLATTTTGASGDYAFVHLLAGAYRVRVTDLYNVLAGYTPASYPADQASDNSNKRQPYTVTLPAGGYNLTADFGYTGGGGGQGTGVIGNLVWEDLNADGTYQVGEPGIGNVTVGLWYAGTDCVADFLVETQTTTSTVTLGENYRFSRTDLPAGNYLVQVTDANGVLVGYTQSVGPNHGNDNNSQYPQPYCIVGFPGSAANGTNLTADFGYWRPAGLGDLVWQDSNANGLQDESPLQGLTNVQITVYAANGTPVAQVVTVNGLYSVTGLVPGTYTVTVTIPPSGYFPTTPETQVVTLVSGQTNNDVDFGYVYPTGLALVQFNALAGDGVVWLQWQVEGLAPQGFHVWRAENAKGLEMVRLTSAPVTAAVEGAYGYVDQGVVAGQSYWYWLEDVASGQRYGPREVTVPLAARRTFLPLATGR